MVPTPEIKTAVQVTFPGTNLIEGSLRDYKNHVDVDMIIPDSLNKSKVVGVILVVSRYDNGTVTNTKTYALKKDGSTSIGTQTSVGSNDVKYEDANGNSFEDSTHYVFKLKVVIRENNGTVNHHNASFKEGESAPTSSYDYLHRADGGDKFDVDNMSIENPLQIENGSNIILNCPIGFVNEEDSDKPTHVMVTFDPVDQYAGDDFDTDNSESLFSFSALLAFEESGEYTIPDNDLENDTAYVASVTAIYANGYTTSATLPDIVYSIASPVIDSVTAYGLDSEDIPGVDKDGAGDPLTDTVMNVSLAESTNPEKILPVSGNVTFKLSQGSVVYYTATVPVSDGDYTVHSSDLTKVWDETQTPPTKNPDQSYDYDVTAEIEYTTESGTVTRTSNSFAAKFTDDINQVSSVEMVNSWVAACNVMGEGDRTVDISDETTAQGYNVAPRFSVVGYFSKHDSFSGNGNTDGFDHDLDTSDTKFQIKMSVDEGEFQVVQNAYMMLSDSDEKTVQENTIDILSLPVTSKQTNVNGEFDNIPGTAGVPGSQQPDIYFCIDEDELTRLGATQGSGLKVSVAIQPPDGLTTRPGATESNQVALVHKVNRYPNLESDSEPTFTGSGSDGILSIPIDNPTIPEGDLYFIHSIVRINSYTSAVDHVKEVTDDGVYNHVIEDPENRGTSDVFKYQVSYKINDPNGGTVTGPMSDEYQIYLKDEPTVDNFTVSNYEYNVFNDDSESSFKFDVQFQDVGVTSIDGVMVYYQYDTQSEVLVAKVERSNGDSQTNLTVTLTTVSAGSSSSSDGIHIQDIDGDAVSYLWLNFTDANIVFKPYYTPKVDSSDDEPVVINDPDTYKIMNVPEIDLPADVSLTGGVLESYNDTVMNWTDDLNKYDGLGSIAASFYLEENTQNVTTDISNNDSFEIDLGNTPSTYTMDLSVKLVSNVDEREFYSKSVVLVFNSVSVDMSGMTVTIRRGSADVNLKAEYVDYTTNPPNASNLNVTAVELIDNPDGNVNPEDEDIRVLDCTNTEDPVQPPAPTINTYSIATYNLGDEILATMRMEAGVDYSLKYGDADASDEESTPLYLTLNGPSTSYIVGVKPSVTIDGSSYVVPSGTYVGQTAIPLKLDAKGLKAQGLQSVVVVIVKENDYTDENDTADGAEVVLEFESSNGRVKSYVTEPDANTATGSSDNLGANETHVLPEDDVDGFSESSSSGNFILVTGSIDGNDASVLYLPADSELVGSTLNVVVFMSTSRGTDVAFGPVTPL
jgi:hypothetical protein